MKPYRPAQPGSANHQAKLLPLQAETIRRARAAGTPLAPIVSRYRIGKSQVSRIGRGEKWHDLWLDRIGFPPDG